MERDRKVNAGWWFIEKIGSLMFGEFSGHQCTKIEDVLVIVYICLGIFVGCFNQGATERISRIRS